MCVRPGDTAAEVGAYLEAMGEIGGVDMAAQASTAGLALVDSDDVADAVERGRKLKRRRNLHGLSERALAEAIVKQGGKMDRGTIRRAEAGAASPGTYDRLEAWFDRWEDEIGEHDAEDRVEIEVRDIVGIGQVIYRGPVQDVPEFEAMIERLMKRATEGNQ